MSTVTSGNDFNLDPGQDLVIKDSGGRERIRLDSQSGLVHVRNAAGQTIFFLDADGANIRLGGSGKDGDLLLFPRNTSTHEPSLATIHLDADQAAIRLGTNSHDGRMLIGGSQGDAITFNGATGNASLTGRIDIRNNDGDIRMQLNPSGNMLVGGSGADGTVRIRNRDGETTILMRGSNADVVFGGNGQAGRIDVVDANDEPMIVLNGQTANAGLGARGNSGGLFVKDETGQDAIVLNGETGNIGLGRDENAGGLFVKDESGQNAIVLNGETGNIGLGRDGNAGGLFVKNETGQNVFVVNGEDANVAIGGNGDPGHLFMKDHEGNDTIVLNGSEGNMVLGGGGHAGGMFVRNSEGNNTMEINGQSGDIIFSNGDCAEEFEISDTADVEAGCVMVLGEDDGLRPCTTAYDQRVVGVVAGAGDLAPGIVLGKIQSDLERLPVTLMGKAFCKVDARYGPIRVGDLLTTSPTPGHAMKANDPGQAFGSVIGKALKSHSENAGLIPILATLQ